MKVSYYQHIKQTTPTQDVTINQFIKAIKDGKWEDLVLNYRANPTKENKQKCPSITVSGTFEKRKAQLLKEHSGFIAIDFDDVKENQIEPLKNDPYTYALFRSIGGYGYCAIVRIDKKMHVESYIQLSNYYYAEYNLETDPSCKDVSRARFVSYDPDLFYNASAKKFQAIKRKEKEPTNYTPVISSDENFERVFSEVIQRGVNLTDTYQNWINIGFLLIDRFSEAEARSRYHLISEQHPEYDAKKTDKKFDSLLKNRNPSKKCTDATFYYLAKQHGIQTQTQREREILQAAKIAKKSGKGVDAVNRQLTEGLGLKPLTESERESVKALPEEITTKEKTENVVQDVRAWLNMNANIWKCAITQNFYDGHEKINDEHINYLWEQVNVDGIKASKDVVSNLVTSKNVKVKDNLRDFFTRNKCEGINYVEDLINCVPKKDEELSAHLMFHWLLASIETLFKKPLPYMLVLTGKQDTGKTSWFRGLIPKELNEWYAESSLDRGKDDEMLMSQKWIIMNDEFKGATIKEVAKLKDILSKQKFTLRAPYAKFNLDYRRIATIGATSNEKEIIHDHTGNRRILPVEVTDSIDWESYNAIPKDKMWGQVFNYWEQHSDIVEIPKETLIKLQERSNDYRDISMLETLLLERFKPNESAFSSTATIFETMQPLFRTEISSIKLGRTLQQMGFEKIRSRKHGNKWGYKLELKPFYEQEKSRNTEKAPF